MFTRSSHTAYVKNCEEILAEAWEQINALGGVIDTDNPYEVKVNNQLGTVLDEIEWLTSFIKMDPKSVTE